MKKGFEPQWRLRVAQAQLRFTVGVVDVAEPYRDSSSAGVRRFWAISQRLGFESEIKTVAGHERRLVDQRPGRSVGEIQRRRLELLVAVQRHRVFDERRNRLCK